MAPVPADGHDGAMRSLTEARLVTLVVVLAAAALAPARADADPLAGRWEGAVDPAALDLRIEVEFTPRDGGYGGTLDVPLQRAHGLPLRDVRRDADGAIAFTVPDLPGSASFEGRMNGDRIEGLFRQGGSEVPFVLTRAVPVEPVATPAGWPGTWRAALAPGAVDLEMILDLRNEGGHLAGTLAIPDQGLADLELRFASAGDGVTILVPALPFDARFELRWAGGELVGSYEQEGVSFPVVFVPEGGADGPSPSRSGG